MRSINRKKTVIFVLTALAALAFAFSSIASAQSKLVVQPQSITVEPQDNGAAQPLSAVTASSADAQGVEIEVAADLGEITVGDVVNYQVTLTWNPDELESDPLIEENLGAVVVRDRVALKRETLSDGRIRRTQSYSITSYKVGEYELPPPLVKYTPKGEKAVVVAGEPVKLIVRSIAPEDATEIRDIKPPRKAPRDLTKPALYAAGVFAGFVILILLVVWIVRRRRAKEFVEPAEPPYEKAMRRLGAAKKLPRETHEEMKEYYVVLSAIVRDYLDGRFMIPAPLLTTRQLEHFIEQEPSRAPFEAQGILNVLGGADFVKFARYMPDDEIAAADFETVKSFIQKTGSPVDDGEEKAEETAA